MRIILTSFVLLSLIIVNETFAQFPTATATATVSMLVNGTTALTKIRDLDMGFVVQGNTSLDIDPITGGTQTAYFIFIADPNSTAIISFSAGNLTSGSDVIAFTGLLAGGTSPNQRDAVSLASGIPFTSSPTGTFYFWAGGAAALSTVQPLGTYSGNFTLAITY